MDDQLIIPAEYLTLVQNDGNNIRVDHFNDNLLVLETKIEHCNSEQEKIDTLNDLAWLLRYRQKERAMSLCLQTNQLSTTGSFAENPYLPGLARSLATQGLIGNLLFQLDESLEISLKALSMLEKLPAGSAVIDARCSVTWGNVYAGDYSTAYFYALPALNLSRELGIRDREAYVLDVMGCIYGKTNEFELAIQHHLMALQITREIDDLELEMIVLNNMATILIDKGKYQEGYSLSMKSLLLARQLHIHEDELVIATTVSDALIKMHSLDQAENLLQKYIQDNSKLKTSKPTFYLLFSMANLELEQGKYLKAEAYLLQSLAIAIENGFKNDQMICYELLFSIYEKTNQPEKALQNYKQFFTIKEATIGAETARKISLLNTSHQMELGRREAELIRKQNLELQHEIEERKHVESLLEELAIRDPLTNLYNRRHFAFLAQNEFERSQRHNFQLAVLMLDIDHFKEVNDHHGHLIGDRVLTTTASIISSSLRTYDFVCRYGGEEFAFILPETSAAQAHEVAERCRRLISENSFQVGGLNFSVTASIGIAVMNPNDHLNEVITLQDLIHQADLALYMAKNAGRNQVQIYEVSKNPHA